MFRHVDPRSPIPLYVQIATRLRVAMATGEIAPGLSLPSVRQLAAEIRVNPATVVQAYKELEHDGLVESRQGAGTFVRGVSDNRRGTERQREARRLVRSLVTEASSLGLSHEDLEHAWKVESGGRTS
jgi:GntR family transcriptional regulator